MAVRAFLGLPIWKSRAREAGVEKSKAGMKARGTHTRSFQGVDNVEAIRDLILERLRLYQDGLGDPDGPREKSAGALEAAQEVSE